MSSGWNIDLSGTGQVSGWGDNDYDIRTIEDTIQEKKSKKNAKKRDYQAPLSPTGDPTSMLIKHSRYQKSADRVAREISVGAVKKIRPDGGRRIHRGAKIAEEHSRRRSRMVESAYIYKIFQIGWQTTPAAKQHCCFVCACG